MCSHSPALTFENILADTLVRLVMAADGVSEAEMRTVLERARSAVAERSMVAQAAPARSFADQFDLPLEARGR